MSIDRVVSAWFLKRFIDENAQFAFIEKQSPPPPTNSFGVFGSEYFNKGRDSTFIVLLKRKGFADERALQVMGALSNDTTGWRYGAGSVQMQLLHYVANARSRLSSDREVVAECLPLFDAMYLALGGDVTRMVAGQQRIATACLDQLRRGCGEPTPSQSGLLESGPRALSSLEFFYSVQTNCSELSESQRAFLASQWALICRVAKWETDDDSR